MNPQGRILVVDDEESVRFSLDRFLQKAGYEVSVASGIGTAKPLVETKAFDAAIVDRVLGDGEDGLDFVTHLKERQPFCQIILISAYPSFQSAVHVLSAGAFAYIVKPVRKTEILKAAEEAVRQSIEVRENDRRKRLFHSFFDHSSNAIVIYDLGGRVRYMNQQFATMFGYTPEECLGEKLWIIPESDREETLKSLTTAVGGERVPDRETIRCTRDGREIPVSLSLSVCCDEKGVPTDILAVMRDISRSLALRKRLRKARTMEALGTLARGIVHDFNNLLVGIRGYIELATMRTEEDHPAMQDMEMARKAADRAQDLVRQISTFGSRGGFRSTSINATPILEEALDLLKISAGAHISLLRDVNPNSPRAMVDPTQFHQVVMNLCTNACQAMSERGGILEVSFGPVCVEGDEWPAPDAFPPPAAGDYLRLAVRDTGVGMDAETLEHLFEPFFSRRDGGTGIGLSVVYGIVKRHGGEITVRSEPGAGTLFEVYLPRADDNSVKTSSLGGTTIAGTVRNSFVHAGTRESTVQ